MGSIIKLEFGDGNMGTDKNNDKGKIEFVNGSSVEFIPSEGEPIRGTGWTIVSVGDGIFYSEYGGEIIEIKGEI